MTSFILLPAQQEELRERLRKEKRVKIHRRLKFIENKSKGLSHWDIAPALGVCNDTLTDWLRLFTDSGFEGLCGLKYEGRRFSRLEPVKDEIKKQVERELRKKHGLRSSEMESLWKWISASSFAQAISGSSRGREESSHESGGHFQKKTAIGKNSSVINKEELR